MHSNVVDVLIITCTFVECFDHLNYQRDLYNIVGRSCKYQRNYHCDLDNVAVRSCNYQLNYQCYLDNIVVKGVPSSVVARCLDYYRLI